MKILTINAGSSSMKFSIIELPEEKELINGYFQRIGLENSFYDLKINGEKLFLKLYNINPKFKLKYMAKRIIINLPIINLEKHYIYYLVDLLQEIISDME